MTFVCSQLHHNDPVTKPQQHWVRSDTYELEVWPDHGAKVASLRALDRQWLVPGQRWTSRPNSTSRFVDVAVSGWDEMIPTIDSCVVNGCEMADHGDAWRYPWIGGDDADTDGTASSLEAPNQLSLRFTSHRGDYELARTISCDEQRVRLDYALTARSPISVLWAAHPLFMAHRDSRIVVPAEVDEVLDISVPEAPMTVRWSAATSAVDSVPQHAYRKYVVPQLQRLSWAAIVHDDDSWLRLRWPSDLVPHLGLYLEQQAFSPMACIAIEPMTGWYDSLAQAIENGTALAAGTTASQWWLEIDVGVGSSALYE
jgi:galactose mutarotase-like enzyme